MGLVPCGRVQGDCCSQGGDPRPRRQKPRLFDGTETGAPISLQSPGPAHLTPGRRRPSVGTGEPASGTVAHTGALRFQEQPGRSCWGGHEVPGTSPCAPWVLCPQPLPALLRSLTRRGWPPKGTQLPGCAASKGSTQPWLSEDSWRPPGLPRAGWSEEARQGSRCGGGRRSHPLPHPAPEHAGAPHGRWLLPAPSF